MIRSTRPSATNPEPGPGAPSRRKPRSAPRGAALRGASLLATLLAAQAPAPAAGEGARAAGSAGAFRFAVTRDTLPNGLRVLIAEDHSAPTLSCVTFFRIGSRNERPGVTGISHLLEHLMFDGAAKYGPFEFDRVLEANGGENNASTSEDFTLYWENVASDRLELVLDLDSDRIHALALTERGLAAERGIVKNERLLAVENDVEGAAYEKLIQTLFTRHPYQWDVGGTMEDLDAITLDDVRDHYRTGYAPGNATIVIAGDVRREEALALLRRYHGKIPRAPLPPGVDVTEPQQTAERRVRIRRECEAPLLMAGYHGARFGSADHAALDLLGRILASGESSRLVRRLVRETEVATRVDVDNEARIDPGVFRITLTLRPGRSHGEAGALLDEELARLARGPVEEAELRKAKRKERADRLFELAGNQGRAVRLGLHETMTGDFANLFRGFERLEAVTSADLLETARRILRPENRALVLVEPYPGSSGGKGGDGE